MSSTEFSWGKMSPIERIDAETRGRWTNSKCRKCKWHDPFNGCCSFILWAGRIRRKADTYGGACPEYEPRQKGRKQRTRPYGEIEQVNNEQK